MKTLLESGDWKVPGTGRLESLPYEVPANNRLGNTPLGGVLPTQGNSWLARPNSCFTL